MADSNISEDSLKNELELAESKSENVNGWTIKVIEE